jgi:hypothetical protein
MGNVGKCRETFCVALIDVFYRILTDIRVGREMYGNVSAVEGDVWGTVHRKQSRTLANKLGHWQIKSYTGQLLQEGEMAAGSADGTGTAW